MDHPKVVPRFWILKPVAYPTAAIPFQRGYGLAVHLITGLSNPGPIGLIGLSPVRQSMA
jgi:hypothetical protein